MGDHKARMLAGELYLTNDGELAADRERAQTLMDAYNATTPQERDRRRQLLRQLVGRLGEQVEIRPPFFCDYGYLISIGDRAFLNFNVVILDCAPITIGDDVQIASGVQLLGATHPLDPALRRAGWESGRPITIASNVWLGAGALVCPGVTIGENTVVGAGSVVTRDLPPAVLAVGNPCRPIRDL